jgi:hypothetical protein
VELALGCEAFRGGLLGQPAAALTSLAFVAAGTAAWRRRPRPPLAYPSLVVAVGVGSFIQHGPHPDWQAYAHDLPLSAVLAYTAVDAVSDLTGRRRSPLWWLLPTAAVAPLVAVGPHASSAGQTVLAGAAVGLNLWRAVRRPRSRRVLLTAFALLAAGALAGNLGDRTALCRPESLWQGHAAWHLLAAAALWRLTPVVGTRAEADRGADDRARNRNRAAPPGRR